LPGGAEWVRIEVPHLDVSSTDLRARIIEGRPLDYLIPPGTLRVIEERDLYRDGAAEVTS